MSYTNHTDNYDLPQYIGTDKPTYLGDFNGAMTAIDTQMKANNTLAQGASTAASSANTNIGTMSSLTTEEKDSLVGAINEVNAKAPVITMTAIDPSEGSPLAANHFVAVYEA